MSAITPRPPLAAPMPRPLHWGVEALWQQLEPLLPGLSIEVVEQTASTNSALLERARATADAEPADGPARVRRSVEGAAFGRRAVDVEPCLLVAELQTSGRGRMGRHWHAETGASLTFSLGLPLHATDWSGLSLAVGVALCEALGATAAGAAAAAGATATGGTAGGATAGGATARGAAAGGASDAGAISASTSMSTGPAAAAAPRPRLGLKWPNDLWLVDAPQAGHPSSGRKLGGILVETVSAGTARLAVIGVGLNVAPQSAAGFGSGQASVQELDPAATPPGVLSRVALPLVRALQRFEAEGFAAFAERFAALDLLAGRSVRTTQPDAADGVACGVTPQGALRVQTTAGMLAISSGEVSVRPASPGPGAA